MEWRAKNSTRFQLFRIRFGHVMEILHDISCNSLLYFEISAVGGTYCDNLTSHLTHFSNLFLQANIYWPKFSLVSLHLHQNLETLISSHWTRCFGHASQKTSTPPKTVQSKRSDCNRKPSNLLTDLSLTDPRFFSTSAILGTEPELVALPAADFPFFFLLYKINRATSVNKWSYKVKSESDRVVLSFFRWVPKPRLSITKLR